MVQLGRQSALRQVHVRAQLPEHVDGPVPAIDGFEDGPDPAQESGIAEDRDLRSREAQGGLTGNGTYVLRRVWLS
jgi:hypothetical protein